LSFNIFSELLIIGKQVLVDQLRDIAFTATDSSIRAYVTERTGDPGELIERYPTALKVEGGLEDIDLSEISDPWNCGLGKANVLLERPLGRGWLVIQGGPR